MRFLKSFCLILVFANLSIPVFANTVTFEFSGFVDAIYDNENNVLEDIYLNQPFSGWFSYSSVPNLRPDYDQDASFSITLGNQTLSYIDDHIYISVRNDYSDEGDKFSFGVDGSQGDYDFNGHGIDLIDSTGTVFNDGSLPMSFDLSRFDSAILSIGGYKLSESIGGRGHKLSNWDWFDASGQITSLTLIPEPGTVLLIGLGGLAVLRKRRS